MRNLFWIVPLVAILAVVGGRLWYYGGLTSSYSAPSPELPPTNFTEFAKSARLEAVDNPTVSKGVIAVDYTHSNALYIEELNVLFSKLVSRGFSYEIILGADDKDAAVSPLADKLRYAKSLILPLPRTEYTPEEIAEIKNFVNKGGRVLIIGDPTRTVVVEALNSIAGTFGIIYSNDYLYSLSSNDNNYRNVAYTNFKESPLTKGLDKDSKVIFYGGGSLNAPGHEIILGDETTHSSISEGGRMMAAAALTTDDKVLALGDLTFFGEPYSAAESNGIFINNIADFLAGSQREFELKDFPFYLNPAVDVVFDNSLVLNSQLDNSVKLKEFLEKNERTVTFTDKIGPENDVIFVGRFDQAEPVKDILAQGGITILGLDEQDENSDEAPAETGPGEVRANLNSDTPPGEEDRFVTGRIRIKGVGELERGGATLFYLNQAEGRNALIILSDTPKTNTDGFDLLFKNRLSECRLSAAIAVCQTQEPDGQLPPSLRSKRIDKVLVVAGDSGRLRDKNNPETGAVEFTAILSRTYQVDTWLISEQGSPDVDELLEYDAVVWSTGAYWDDSISEEDAALLSKYIELGGNLILSGASIGFDWDHTDFLTQVAHADYLTFAKQSDLELALPDHPIAKDFPDPTVIAFSDVVSGTADLEPDVINNTPNARVIFQRGPDSKQPGAASVVAYEDDRSKIAYLAFPIYLLPVEERDLLVNNIMNWFTRKPLPLPDEGDYQPFEPEEPGPEATEEPAPEGTAEPSPEATEEPTPENGQN
ncbi:MAG: hypothetical protein Fur0044_11260 [Anaerolineae bacterium]|nr:hypothetical protein [Anaerolineales bacterium]MCQ3975528.1 hypothetical protein [Anaerolineae bacterium]